MSSNYSGNLNSKMFFQILKDHEKDLTDYEKEGLRKLRTKISDITKGIDNIKVTIYLDKIGYITVQQGAGDNKLVIQFSKNSEIDYVWEKKTFGQRMYEGLDCIARRLVFKALFPTFLAAITGLIRRQITWY